MAQNQSVLPFLFFCQNSNSYLGEDTSFGSNHKPIKDKSFSFQGAGLSSDMNEDDRRESKGNKKKVKKTMKRNNPESFKNLLGFDEYVPSPFDFENGYSIEDSNLMHFKERPVKKKILKSSNFSASQHVQANHRFILKPNRNQDYFLVTYEPDYEVNWEEIFLVHAKRNADYICPICREEKMVAPQISKWGHIFCWPCILHYMLYSTESEGDNWRKCPLWEELVFKSSLKFVKVYIKPPPKEEEVYSFSLAFRNQCSAIVKYYEDSDLDHEERSKFDNLEVYYNDSSAYNITRIRVWKEFEEIFSEFRTQLQENWKDSEGFGDTLRIGLWQEALDAINKLESEVKRELEYINQQRSTNENNMAEIDQSNKEFQQSNENLNKNSKFK